MIELQTALDALMSLITDGGPEAAKVLFKGVVLNGAKQVSALWKSVFEEAPDAYPLADRVARNPDDGAQAGELRALVEKVLREHPALLPPGGIAVVTRDSEAKNGSVAAAVIKDSPIIINNR